MRWGAAGARRRPARARLHPRPGRLDHLPRRAGQGRAGPVRPAPGPSRGEGPAAARVMPARDGPALQPGELHVSKHAVLVGTASTPVELGEVRPHGKKPMAAADWARGVRIAPGERLDG